MGGSFDSDFDPQDQAEAFDETNTVGGEGVDSALEPAGEMRTFEELPELLDVTRADGDRDDDEALALDADEFDPEASDDADLEDDNELAYHAATEEREDDIDGLGPEDGYNDAELSAKEIDGLHEVRDADQAEGGEDDFTDFQAKGLGDEDLKAMGYSEDRGGETRAKPDGD